ncbi:MAG: serine hydrolase [Bacteroidales bacterium]|nr:serine hydrolase [Bacteroidales bacterium]
MKRFLIISAISILALSSCKKDVPTLPKGFDSYCETTVSQWHIPAMTAVVVKDGEVVYLKGFGKTKQDKTGVPVDPETTQFVMASTTKAMTGTLLAGVIDEYDVDWTDPVKKHLPDFRMYDKWVSDNMMVEEVNAHHHGWKSYALDDLPMFGYDREDIYKLFAAVKPTYSFRTKYAYNNEMYTVSAKIIEKYTGMSWDDAIAERLFKPLKMVHSTTGAKAFHSSKDLAYGYEVDYDVQKDSLFLNSCDDRDDAFTWMTAVAPAAFAMTTGSDMANYLKMHLNHGVFEGDTLVSRANHDYLFKPQTITGYSDNYLRTYAQGWIVEQNNKERYIRHTGLAYGYTALVGLVPELGLGFAFMCTNGTTSDPLEAMGKKLIDMYLGVDGPDYATEWLEDFKDEYRNKKDKEAKEELPATLPLKAYTGVYHQNEFGDATVSVLNDTLRFQLKKVDAKLKHVSEDTFNFHVPGAGNFDLTFDVKNGKAVSLTFDIVDPICELKKIR